MKRNNESISALVDGELDQKAADFLLRRLSSDDETHRIWQRFHMVRASMRREFPGPVSLVGRVHAAIESEQAPVQRPSTMAAAMRIGIGGALAASVAVLAVVGLGNRMAEDTTLDRNSSDSGFVSQTTALDRQFSRQAVPAGFNPGASQRSDASAASESESQQRINRYLIRHGQVTGGNGFVSYAPILTTPATLGHVPGEDNSAKSARDDSVDVEN